MLTRLEKIIPVKRQRQFYTLSIGQTLFGEWCLIREWRRIGVAGGQRLVKQATILGSVLASCGTHRILIIGQKWPLVSEKGHYRPNVTGTN